MPGFFPRRSFVVGVKAIRAPSSRPHDLTIIGVLLVRPLVGKEVEKCMELSLVSEPTFWDKFLHVSFLLLSNI
jgi:hypothetical protein